MRYLDAGRVQNAQQGTTRRTTGKSEPASAYPRSYPDSGRTDLSNEWRSDKDARDKKHGTGKYSRQKLFP